MAKKLFTAIVFINNIDIPRKYRNISNLNSFRQFAHTIDGALYYNLYDKATKLFVERIYIQKGT
jgi:hypothetical protein